MKKHFATIAVFDFEYEVSGGEYNLREGDLPAPLCMVAYVLDENLRHVRTIRMWREELLASKRPPFDVGPDTLCVAYSAWAELTCFMVLGWTFPVYVFDLHTAYLAASNIARAGREAEERAETSARCLSCLRDRGLGTD